MNRFILSRLREKENEKQQIMDEQKDMKFINTNFESNNGLVVSGGNNNITVTFSEGKMDVKCEPKTEEANVIAESESQGNEFGTLIPNDFDKTLIIQRLHNLIDGKQAAEAVKVIMGSIEGGVLLRVPTYTQMKNEFGVICTKSGFYQLTKKQFFDNELRPIINYLKA